MRIAIARSGEEKGCARKLAPPCIFSYVVGIIDTEHDFAINDLNPVNHLYYTVNGSTKKEKSLDSFRRVYKRDSFLKTLLL